MKFLCVINIHLLKKSEIRSMVPPLMEFKIMIEETGRKKDNYNTVVSS
jgi:hypothetical protein